MNREIGNNVVELVRRLFTTEKCCFCLDLSTGAILHCVLYFFMNIAVIAAMVGTSYIQSKGKYWTFNEDPRVVIFIIAALIENIIFLTLMFCRKQPRQAGDFPMPPIWLLQYAIWYRLIWVAYYLYILITFIRQGISLIQIILDCIVVMLISEFYQRRGAQVFYSLIRKVQRNEIINERMESREIQMNILNTVD